MRKTIKQISDEMKTLERTVESCLPHVGYVIIRIDGRSFHSLTRGMEKPFDSWFVAAMDNAAKRVMEGANAIAAYVQSDEINLIIDPHGKNGCSLPFNGRVEKLVSLSASSAAVGFYEYYSKLKTKEYRSRLDTSTLLRLHGDNEEDLDEFYDDYYDDSETDDRIEVVLARCPQFDSRVISLETVDEVEDYLTWRRMDCMQNSVSTYALSEFSPSQLHGKSTSERLKMLAGVYGENFRIPDSWYWGRLLVKTKFEDNDRWAVYKTGDQESGMTQATIMRTTVETKAATKSAVEELILALRNRANRSNATENA